MPRFYLPPDELASDRPGLTGQEAGHAEVRRLKAGQEVSLFDGRGGEAIALVEEMGRRSVSLRVIYRPQPMPDARPRIKLGLGLVRWERLRVAVEKATELGVEAIWLLKTEYAQPRQNTRPEKLERVVIESLKQCGRSRGPKIGPAVGLEDFLNMAAAAGAKFFLNRGGPHLLGLVAGRPAPEEAVILVGPEGGLSQAEMAAAEAAGCRAAGLSPALLRTETAALLAVGLLQAAWGEAAEIGRS